MGWGLRAKNGERECERVVSVKQRREIGLGKKKKKLNPSCLYNTQEKKGFNLVFCKDKIHLIGHHFQLNTNLGFLKNKISPILSFLNIRYIFLN